MIYLHYIAYYLQGAGLTTLVVMLSNLWLGKNGWTQKTMAWMSVLWPITALVLFGTFFIIGIVRLAAFICDKPKSSLGARIKNLISRAGDAVFEPIVNRIVKESKE